MLDNRFIPNMPRRRPDCRNDGVATRTHALHSLRFIYHARPLKTDYRCGYGASIIRLRSFITDVCRNFTLLRHRLRLAGTCGSVNILDGSSPRSGNWRDWSISRPPSSFNDGRKKARQHNSATGFSRSPRIVDERADGGRFARFSQIA